MRDYSAILAEGKQFMDSLESYPNTFLNVARLCMNSYFASKELKPATIENNIGYLKIISRYLESIRNRDYDIRSLDQYFAQDFIAWLRKERYVQYQAGRVLDICKRVTRYARAKGIIMIDPLEGFKIDKGKPKEVVHLEKNELQKMFDEVCIDKEKEIVQDIYLWSTETGMSYGDLWSYQIIKDNIGTWVRANRYKTGNLYWVLLSSKALEIHNKYSGKLPRITNKKYNHLIKVIAKEKGITKHLTTHTARKTFATKMYEEGWSIESIADMMGITIDILLKHYIKKSRRRLENEIRNRMTA